MGQLNTSPVVTVWSYHDDDGLSGLSPSDDREFVRSIERHGHAIVTDSRHCRPINHNIIGAYYDQRHPRFFDKTGKAGVR